MRSIYLLKTVNCAVSFTDLPSEYDCIPSDEVNICLYSITLLRVENIILFTADTVSSLVTLTSIDELVIEIIVLSIWVGSVSRDDFFFSLSEVWHFKLLFYTTFSVAMPPSGPLESFINTKKGNREAWGLPLHGCYRPKSGHGRNLVNLVKFYKPGKKIRYTMAESEQKYTPLFLFQV